MCVAVPMEITEIVDDHTAMVASGEVQLKVDVSLITDPAPGDFIIIHAGYAIEKLETEEALATLDLFDELGKLDNPA